MTSSAAVCSSQIVSMQIVRMPPRAPCTLEPGVMSVPPGRGGEGSGTSATRELTFVDEKGSMSAHALYAVHLQRGSLRVFRTADSDEASALSEASFTKRSALRRAVRSRKTCALASYSTTARARFFSCSSFAKAASARDFASEKDDVCTYTLLL
jgi:hypothetical protein